jgi:arylsulfatase A-like enzyme
VVNVIGEEIDAAGNEQADLDPSLTTLPEALGAGYSSGLFGKWHVGETYHPKDHGWAKFSGVLGGALDDYKDWDKLVEETGKSPSTVNYTGADADYATFINVDDAASWINSQTGKWMATVAFNAAHKTTGSTEFTQDDDPPNLRGCSPSA